MSAVYCAASVGTVSVVSWILSGWVASIGGGSGVGMSRSTISTFGGATLSWEGGGSTGFVPMCVFYLGSNAMFNVQIYSWDLGSIWKGFGSE